MRLPAFLSDQSKRRWLLPAVSVLVGILEVRSWHPMQQEQLGVTLGLWVVTVGVWMAGSIRPHWALTLGLGACSVALSAMSQGPTAVFAMFGTLIQTGIRLPPRRGLPIAAAAVLGFETVHLLRTHIDPLDAALSLLGWCALYAAGAAYQQLREEQARTQATLEQLRLSRAAQLESAKVEERARLAREIHDVLAHTLSALAVQLESGRMLLEQRPGDPAGLRAVERAHRLAHDGLVEARRAVGALRGGTLPGPDALQALADDFEQDTGVRCRVEVEGEPAQLSHEARLAVYRTAQEALANVRKHASATSVTLRLRWSPDGAELTVDDEGQPKPWGVKGGYGLLGIRERAELLGGRLEAGPVEHGFRVRLWVPS